jgi:outer membrane protein TolC
LHGGPLLSARGVVIDASLQSMYGGFGAEARGGGTVAIPGVRLVSHLGDAYFAPKAAEQKVVQSRLDATATRSYILADVGVAYLRLVEAHAQLEAYRQSFTEFVEIEQITANFAKKGQGREADAERARTETLLLRAAARRSDEAIGVAAAELAQLLDRDPSVALRPADVTPPLLEFAEAKMPMDELDHAAASHPEVVARAADILFQEIRLKQERMRPLLPVVAVGFSAGEFGGGAADTLSHLGKFHPRTDLDVVAVWSLQNFGFGNRAVQNVSRAELEMAHAEYIRVFDRVRREIVEARARIDANRQDIALAQKRVQSSQNAYTQDLVRARNGEGRPLEVLNSAALLATARQDLVRAMTGFSQAQLQLLAALGVGMR